MNLCPCGTQQLYMACCGLYISGEFPAPTAEKLMRSRYTAYTKAAISYIVQTMQPPAAEGFDPDEAYHFAIHTQWLKLEVVRSWEENEQHAFVEFKAYSAQQNKQHVLHELSEFKKQNGLWFYVDGKQFDSTKMAPAIKVARNEPCPCSSGKKFKKCCANS